MGVIILRAWEISRVSSVKEFLGKFFLHLFNQCSIQCTEHMGLSQKPIPLLTNETIRHEVLSIEGPLLLFLILCMSWQNPLPSHWGSNKGILKKNVLLYQRRRVVHLWIRTSPNRPTVPLKREPYGDDTANLLDLLNLEYRQAWFSEGLIRTFSAYDEELCHRHNGYIVLLYTWSEGITADI